jgi:ADP-ribose pyrophosphatase
MSDSQNPPSPKKSRNETASGYPARQHVDEADAPWTKPLVGYAPPVYTANVVFQNEGKWADPSDINAVTRQFVTSTRDGEGRGRLGKWGRNQAGDALLTSIDPVTLRLQLLVIERKDSGQKALPGGMVDDGETITTTVARELFEETGSTLDFDQSTVIYAGIVDDPRNTDNAWMETTVLHKHLTTTERTAMFLGAGDDASSVNWINIDRELLSSMYASHGDYVRQALVHLKYVPEVGQQATDLLDG